jgi:hypothetical protein
MTFCEIPIIANVQIMEVPPLDISSKGTPVSGIKAVTPPIFRNI